MGITADDFATIGLPIENPDAYTVLVVNSAFGWLEANTMLQIDTDSVDSLKALPPVAKLFVLKFLDIMSLGTGVSSESIDTLSHSFESDKSALIWQYAQELLAGYLKSQVSVTTAKRKWVNPHGRC